MGMFGSEIYENDNALNFIDAVRLSDRKLEVILDAYQCLSNFFKRKESGIAPRLQTVAERDHLLDLCEQSTLVSNPHLSVEFLKAHLDQLRQFTLSASPIWVDDGSEEFGKACAAALLVYAIHVQNPSLLPRKARALISVVVSIGSIDASRKALRAVLDDPDVERIYGSKYFKRIIELAKNFEVRQ